MSFPGAVGIVRFFRRFAIKTYGGCNRLGCKINWMLCFVIYSYFVI